VNRTEPAEPHQGLLVVCVVVSILCLLVTAAVGSTVIDQHPQVDKNSAAVQKLAPKANENTKRSTMALAQAKTANRRVIRVNRTQTKLVTVLRRVGVLRRGKAGLSGATGLQGLQGAPGIVGAVGRAPTADEIDAAVARYCLQHACALPPTGDQVTAAVVAFCRTDACGPTVEQVAAGIVSYCLSHACRGLDGPKGDKGDPGMDGAPGAPGSLVVSVQTACPDGNGGFVVGFATDPDADGTYTCP
jgi:hypothetical protein